MNKAQQVSKDMGMIIYLIKKQRKWETCLVGKISFLVCLPVHV